MKTPILQTSKQRRQVYLAATVPMQAGGRWHERKSSVARANGCSSCFEMAGK